MIDRINKTVKAYLNTDGIGNYTPAKFDSILNDLVNGKYEELFFELNRLITRENRGLVSGELGNLVNIVGEKIQHYLEPGATLTYANGLFSLPSDMRYFDDVLYNSESVELCKSNKEFNAVATTNPTEEYPVGIKLGTKISILPTTIQANITASYLRNPKQAKWTYTIIAGVEVFNPDADDFQDVDIHPSEEKDIILRVLQGFGVNLKEIDIQKITQAEKTREFNQENKN